jgi:hypothetical protein
MGLALVGSATPLKSGVIRLTSADEFAAAGAAWYPAPVVVAHGVNVALRFRITPFQPPNNPWWEGGDGMAVVIQNDPNGTHALGDTGAGQDLGYTGIRRSVAVELDTVQNPASQFGSPTSIGDPSGNEISVHTRGRLPNSTDEQYAIASDTAIPNLTSGTVRTLTVSYRTGELQIGMDGKQLITVPINLPRVLGSGRGWIGVTAATGDAAENHDVVALAITR